MMTGTAEENEKPGLYKFLDYLSWTLLIISILLLRIASSYLENIVAGKKFAFEMAAVGFIIASVWMYLLFKKQRPYFDGGEKRASAILSMLFSIVMLTIFASAYYNYQTGMKRQYLKNVRVLNKSKNTLHGTLYITLDINNKKERFNPKRKEWETMEKGDTIWLRVGKGALNHEYIYSFMENQ